MSFGDLARALLEAIEAGYSTLSTLIQRGQIIG